jgi:UDP-2,4-diacetamido-2,4,6-trideoxy-beta-L-altropyranose hydrolase
VAPLLILCADASSTIGTGHVMRSLSLAAGWRAAGRAAAMISYCPVAALRARVTAAGVVLRSLEARQNDPRRLAHIIAQVAHDVPGPKTSDPPWVVLDGYHFDSACQRAVRRQGFRLLVIDDLAHLPAYHADVILNQNLGAEEVEYPCDPGTRLLRGCRYVLLRPEFNPWRPWQRAVPPIARKVLLTLGGSDPLNAMPRLLEGASMARIPDLEVCAVIGAANPHAPAIPKTSAGPARIELLTNVGDMARQMAWADVAVSAAGTSCWEMAFMQLPALITILADNQRSAARRLQAAGLFENLGSAEDLTAAGLSDALSALCRDPARRARQGRLGRRLVDGEGTHRVLAAMRSGD